MQEPMKNNLDWFKNAKYGVFVHYLYPNDIRGMNNDFNRIINEFDTDKFASQVKEAGAGYVMFTLGQNSGYYCAPNKKYDEYTGYIVGERCSLRDLPMDLANSLSKYDIKLMLYLPSGAPNEEPRAREAFSVKERDISRNWNVTDEFLEKWSEVIKEWSLRYGKRIKGWWFDGFYSGNGFCEKYAKRYKEMCLLGNNTAIIALNPGVGITKVSDYEDYTAGEVNEFESYPSDRFLEELQWQTLSFLGDFWGKSSCKYTDEFIYEYIKKCNFTGGVVTMDIYVNRFGEICENQFKQLKFICSKLR